MFMKSHSRAASHGTNSCAAVTKRHLLLVPIIALWVLLTLGCASPQVVFLKNNVHAHRNHDGKLKASYTNWVYPSPGHTVIPANTPVIIGPWRPGFYFITQDTNQRIFFEYDQRYMPYTLSDYINLITASKPITEAAFSEIDRKGIGSGKALTGMSKAGIRVALGYPASHRTPSLKEDVWVYWRNRHRQIRVCFGDDGTVIAVH
jgi:hypothetical protein